MVLTRFVQHHTARRMFCSATEAAAAKLPQDYSFVDSRRKYKQEMSNLRKEFMLEHKKRLERLQQQKASEREKLLKEKESRLAKKQEQKQRNLEVHLQALEQQRELKQSQFKEKSKIRQAHDEAVRVRQEAIVRAVEADAQSWITNDNLEEHFREEMFDFSFEESYPGAQNGNAATSASARSWLERLQQMRPQTNNTTDKE